MYLSMPDFRGRSCWTWVAGDSARPEHSPSWKAGHLQDVRTALSNALAELLAHREPGGLYATITAWQPICPSAEATHVGRMSWLWQVSSRWPSGAWRKRGKQGARRIGAANLARVAIPPNSGATNAGSGSGQMLADDQPADGRAEATRACARRRSRSDSLSRI